MNILLLYFSGTGNTELVTEHISERLIRSGNTIKTIAVETALKNKSMLKEIDGNELIGIGYPVYDLKEPAIISRLIDCLPQPSGTIPVFLYSTMAFIQGDCNTRVANKMGKKGYRFIAGHGFRCPSNGVYTYENPNHSRFRNVRFDPNICRDIDLFCTEILTAFRNTKNQIYPIPGNPNPIYNIFRYFSERSYGDKYYKTLAVSNECSGCGICVQSCPDENLYIAETIAAVKDPDNCLRCLRCISNCPHTAISFTSTQIKTRYTKRVRDKYFKEATGEIK